LEGGAASDTLGRALYRGALYLSHIPSTEVGGASPYLAYLRTLGISTMPYLHLTHRVLSWCRPYLYPRYGYDLYTEGRGKAPCEVWIYNACIPATFIHMDVKIHCNFHCI